MSMEEAETQTVRCGLPAFGGLDGLDEPGLRLGEDDLAWWRDAKFGLFIHWGVYSGIGRGEWAYHNDKYAEEDYRNIAENFSPSRNAEAIVSGWLDAAQAAGMKYAVMVARHHDGFALWDSSASYKNFTSAKLGPRMDYVAAFTRACHERNVYAGLYYSPMDWRFPGYFDPQGKPESALLMKQQAYGQIEELCTNYGKIDILWYDGGWLAHKGRDADAAWLWEPLKLNKLARCYQPKMLINPRSGFKGDFQCDEGGHEVIGGIVPFAWEKNMSLSAAWAYRPEDTFLSSSQVIRMLVNVIIRGGNLLLNIGPDGEGHIPSAAAAVLRETGEWLGENGEAVYGTRAGIYEPVDGIYGSTCKGSTVYVHILDRGAFANLILPPTEKRILAARTLNGEGVAFTQDKNGVRLELPPEPGDKKQVVTVVHLITEG
ncbi:MAG: alpha-L-fucosidase [Treponema sp.]|jgi:alpha-L-fucosidase|nr:alpha-L-fucosidase [Treponema sp.]